MSSVPLVVVPTPPILSWSSFISAEAQPFQTTASLAKAMSALAATVQSGLESAAFAAEVDRLDPVAIMREEFVVPKARDIGGAIIAGHGAAAGSQAMDKEEQLPEELTAQQDAVYLCGNSLGLLPRKAQQYVQEELSKWGQLGVEGHFAGARPWARVDETPTALSVAVVGASSEAEVSVCNSLSANLHLLLTSFYRPTAGRFKILMEKEAFCSDHHVARSQVELHGLKPEDAIVTLSPRVGESCLRTEDIEAAIQTAGDALALVLLPGIQFYTGQLFDMEAITRAAHAVGAYAGFDLAHAVGNVPLRLHDWQVDFAAWCTYKYLNAGPGSIGGLFVHETHHESARGSDEDGSAPLPPMPKLKGWWGQTPSQRFSMLPVHHEKPGAQSYMLSNPAVLPTVCLQASLELFKLADPLRLRSKSMMLTGYLEHMLKTQVGAINTEEFAESVASSAPDAASAAPASAAVSVRILTPRDPSARGAQLSLLFSMPVRRLHRALCLWGIVTDVREPNVLRVSPAPLYNTFSDVFLFVQRLKTVLAEVNAEK